MASKYHKKIQGILKEADLSKKLSEDLRKELESYFYEKEADLSFKGMKPEDIENSIQNDFGDEKLIGSTFQLVHKFSLNSFIKRYMKKIIVTLSIFLFTLIFISPWLWYDGGEDVLESRFFRLNYDSAFKNPRERIPISDLVDESLFTDLEKMCYCDGSCMRVQWAPFGAKVISCADDYYYISFWGHPFHIDAE